jgi:hypothetical protein
MNEADRPPSVAPPEDIEETRDAPNHDQDEFVMCLHLLAKLRRRATAYGRVEDALAYSKAIATLLTIPRS